MYEKGPRNPERSFGLWVGGVLCASAAYLMWRGRFTRAEVSGVIGAMLIVLGLARPALLKRPSDLWWRVARVLGYVNARVLLTLLFAVGLVPIGALWRLFRIDPLARRRTRWMGWSPYAVRYRDHKHYLRMY